MKTLIDIEQWNRKEHFLFFSQFEEPFFGATVNIDRTQAYKTAKEKGNSFFYILFIQNIKGRQRNRKFPLQDQRQAGVSL